MKGTAARRETWRACDWSACEPRMQRESRLIQHIHTSSRYESSRNISIISYRFAFNKRILLPHAETHLKNEQMTLKRCYERWQLYLRFALSFEPWSVFLALTGSRYTASDAGQSLHADTGSLSTGPGRSNLSTGLLFGSFHCSLLRRLT